MTTDLGIGSPPIIAEKEAIKFIACANNAHAECVRESATQRCSCVCHKAEAAVEPEPTDDFDPVDPSSVDEILDATVTEVLDGTIHTTVDGTEAVIKPTPEQPPLVNVSLEDLVHDLNIIHAKLAEASTKVDAAKKRVKEMTEIRDQTIFEIMRRDNRGEQIGLGVE